LHGKESSTTIQPRPNQNKTLEALKFMSKTLNASPRFSLKLRSFICGIVKSSRPVRISDCCSRDICKVVSQLCKFSPLRMKVLKSSSFSSQGFSNIKCQMNCPNLSSPQERTLKADFTLSWRLPAHNLLMCGNDAPSLFIRRTNLA